MRKKFYVWNIRKQVGMSRMRLFLQLSESAWLRRKQRPTQMAAMIFILIYLKQKGLLMSLDLTPTQSKSTSSYKSSSYLVSPKAQLFRSFGLAYSRFNKVLNIALYGPGMVVFIRRKNWNNLLRKNYPNSFLLTINLLSLTKYWNYFHIMVFPKKIHSISV